ncbi:MAG TPA: hypothetical protein VMU87_14805 [Stellaceae bacterium]|nr:hypothetical protein [Stellaceae bacterium]
MRNCIWIGFAAAALAGCVAVPDSPGAPPPVPLIAGAPPPAIGAPPPPPVAPPPAPSTGSRFLAVVGTPFYLLFKIPVCVVTVVVAGPIAGISALAGPSNPQAVQVRRDLGEGLAQNCGPPYALSP